MLVLLMLAKNIFGKNISVAGDSHLKRINSKRINDSFEKAKSFIKFFPCAKIQKLEHYVVPHLSARKPHVSFTYTRESNIKYCRRYNKYWKEMFNFW